MALEPSVIRAIAEAFEAAVDELRAKGMQLTDLDLARIAMMMIERAEGGVHDVAALKADAVAFFQK